MIPVLPINNSESSINNINIISVRLDYLLHISVFALWMVLLWKPTSASLRENIRFSSFYIMLGFLFAIVNEAIRHILPYRAYNVNVLMANGGGILLGTGFFMIKHNIGVTKEGG